MAKRKLNRRQKWRIEKIQAERRQRAQRRAGQENPVATALGDEQLGTVVAHFGGQVLVEDEAGVPARCHFRANLEQLVVGDRVIWQAPRVEGEGDGVVTAIEPRQSVLKRPDNYGNLKPVAANVDRLLVVFAPMPVPSTALLDRYLVAAELSGIPATLVLNKADLIDAESRDGVVRGRVTSATGAFDGPLSVLVQRRGGGENSVVPVMWSDDGGARVGRFEAGGLIDAPFVVSFGQTGFFDIEPNYVTVRPDEPELAFVVDDAHAVTSVAVRAVDADTGEPLDAFRAWLTVDPFGDERTQFGEVEEGAEPIARFDGVPADLPWSVRVGADGYAVGWGDAPDLVAGEGSDPGELVVRLHRGWSTRLCVRDESKARLAGVLVLLDGEVAGTTNTDGVVELRAAEAPTSLHVERDGFTPLSDNGYDAEAGNFRRELWRLTLTMRADE